MTKDQFAQTSTRVSDSNYTPVSFEETSDGGPTSSRPRLVSPCTAFMIVLFLIRIIVGIVTSDSKLFSLLFAALAILPAVVTAWWVLRAFHDGSLPNSFLLSQYFVGAVPLFIITTILGVIFTVISALPALLLLPKEVLKKLKDLTSITDEKKGQELMEQVITEVKKLPAWAIVLTIFLLAFLAAGAVEEIGKWLFSRRYKRPLREATDAGRHVGARAILASTAMVSLGFATMENIGYIIGLGSMGGSLLSFSVVGLALLRGLMSFPLHISTQLHVAVAAGHLHVFNDNTRVSVALFHAIIFHGIFDGVTYSSVALTLLEKTPAWTLLATVGAEVFLVGVLILLVRARYTGLLERERVAMSDPV